MKNLILPLILLFLLVIPASAQDLAPDDLANDLIKISWPPPVTEVWSVGDVIGTANIEGMAYYYLEYKALNDDLTIPDSSPWIPVTVAITEPVINGKLATLDTTTVPDGLYALRLTINTVDGDSFFEVVSPLRVNNERFDAVTKRIAEDALNRVETDDENDEAQVEAARPTPVPTIAPPNDNIPRVTPRNLSVNVRRCDLVNNNRCPIISALTSGTFGRVIGINRDRTWYHIVLAGGAQGWVSRTVVTESGDFSGVPVQLPPEPLAPIPVQPTLAPPSVVNQPIPNGMSIDGGQAVCNEVFRVLVNLGNTSNITAPAGTLTLQDVNIRTGQVTYTGTASYPAIAPGQNFVVVLNPKIATYYNEDHELRATVGSNRFTLRYTLQQGDCGAAPAPTPPPSTQRTFNRGECNVNINQTGEVYNRAGGEVSVTIAPGSYSALQVQRVGGLNWYQLELENNAPWVPAVPYITFSGNCSL